MDPSTGPKLLGFDVILVGSILAGIAALAVIVAIYSAVTIKDPMAKRVRALARGSQFLYQRCEAVGIAPRRAHREAPRGKFAHNRTADGIAGTNDKRYPFSHARLPLQWAI